MCTILTENKTYQFGYVLLETKRKIENKTKIGSGYDNNSLEKEKNAFGMRNVFSVQFFHQMVWK